MRIAWIDTLKGFAMLTVVLGHVVQGYQVAGFFPEYAVYLDGVFDGIYSFHMPLFFMASGYLYEMTWNENKSASWGKIRHKFWDTMVLYVLFSLLFWGTKTLAASHVQMNHVISAEELLLIPVAPLSYLWFLYVLMALFVVVPVMVQRVPQRGILLAMFTGGYLLLGPAGTMGRFFYGGFYFVLGSWLRQWHFETMPKNLKQGVFLLSVITCVMSIIRYADTGGQDSFLHDVLIAVSASYIVWYAAAEWGERTAGTAIRFLQRCGERSLELYLLHVYFVGFLRTAFRKAGMGDPLLCILLGTALSVAGSLLLACLGRKVSCLSFLFHPADLLRKYRFIR